MSRKFLYQQQQKGNQALEQEFNPSQEESDILSMDTCYQKVDISGHIGVNFHLS
ncbi:MAG: hypothetical protein QNJ41_10375 [Xenococcaceae cyanobacterium MO_188.B32]|nr:hypothetical protein [Xenococcaceae cyanobacterium MO_188.B32]